MNSTVSTAWIIIGDGYVANWSTFSPPPFWRRKCTSSGAEMRFLEISKISSVGQPHSDTCCQAALHVHTGKLWRVHALPWSSQVRKCIDHLMILLRCIPVPPTPTKKTGNLVPYALMYVNMYILYVYMLYIQIHKHINYLHLLQSTPKYVPLKTLWITRTLRSYQTPAVNCGTAQVDSVVGSSWGKKFIGLTPTFKWMSPRK